MTCTATSMDNLPSPTWVCDLNAAFGTSRTLDGQRTLNYLRRAAGREAPGKQGRAAARRKRAQQQLQPCVRCWHRRTALGLCAQFSACCARLPASPSFATPSPPDPASASAESSGGRCVTTGAHRALHVPYRVAQAHAWAASPELHGRGAPAGPLICARNQAWLRASPICGCALSSRAARIAGAARPRRQQERRLEDQHRRSRYGRIPQASARVVIG